MNSDHKLVFLITFFSFVIGLSSSYSAMQKTEKYDLNLLMKENALEKKGREYELLNEFDLAADQYRAAMALDYQIYGSDRGRAMAFLAEVYQKQKRYQEAYKLVIMLIERHPNHEYYIDWKRELDVLMKFKNDHNSIIVQEYIQTYRKKYQSQLPPNRYSIGSVSYINRILMLNDIIGAYDAGINFIDECLNYMYKQNPDVKKVSNSSEAQEFMIKEKGKKGGGYPYKILREYYLVREAFEKDKASGTKGSATKALIQSDYFPW